MAGSKVSELFALVLRLPVRAYICRQRDRLQVKGRGLSSREKLTLKGYFAAEILDAVRIVIADPLPVPDPPFTSLLRRLGFDFPSPSLTEAITFDNVIASRRSMNASLLFHELVHVVQYRLLGVPEFAHQYVHGFLVNRSYYEIPLERFAFDLQFRYETNGSPFHVASELVRLLHST